MTRSAAAVGPFLLAAAGGGVAAGSGAPPGLVFAAVAVLLGGAMIGAHLWAMWAHPLHGAAGDPARGHAGAASATPVLSSAGERVSHAGATQEESRPDDRVLQALTEALDRDDASVVLARGPAASETARTLLDAVAFLAGDGWLIALTEPSGLRKLARSGPPPRSGSGPCVVWVGEIDPFVGRDDDILGERTLSDFDRWHRPVVVLGVASANGSSHRLGRRARRGHATGDVLGRMRRLAAGLRDGPGSAACDAVAAATGRARLPSFSAALTLAALCGVLSVVVSPVVVVGLVATVSLLVAVAAVPPIGAYVMLATTPLITGIDRGAVLPLLRPSEAVAGLVASGLVVRGLVELARGARPRIRPTAVDLSLLSFAIAGSVIPLLWMAARGRTITSDDVFHALQLWKYVAVFFIVRLSIRTEREVRRCLLVALAPMCIVAVVAILQSLSLFGVPDLLARVYAPEENPQVLNGARGSSTLSSSLAVGDVMVYCLAISGAWAIRGGFRRSALLGLSVLFAFGAMASGQYSAFIAMGVGLVALGAITGRLRMLLGSSIVLLPVVAAAMWPVIATRLDGFDTLVGLPPSWVGRWQNLTTYFWPQLGDFNWLLGVRPSARIAAPESWREWIWIESGHTWLLWAGGVPLFVAFFVLLWFALRRTAAVARARDDAIGVAAAAAFTALCVVAVLMTLDPHITLRGSADLLFSLLALALACGSQRARPSRRRPERESRFVPDTRGAHARRATVRVAPDRALALAALLAGVLGALAGTLATWA